jgi:hypothetical protein
LAGKGNLADGVCKIASDKEIPDGVWEITLPKYANIHAREYQLYLPGKDQLKQKLNEWTAEAGKCVNE